MRYVVVVTPYPGRGYDDPEVIGPFSGLAAAEQWARAEGVKHHGDYVYTAVIVGDPAEQVSQ